MFIDTSELKSVIYEYQLNQITENDSTITAMGIDAAIVEVKSYLRGRYDVEAIFSATGGNRNAMVLECCKVLALWHIIGLSNVDILYERIQDRYDRCISWLKNVANGTLAPDLPINKDENGNAATRFKFGSNPKFNSYYE